jgi:hypothetical protein
VSPSSKIRSGGSSPSAARSAEAFDQTMGPGDVAPQPITNRPPVSPGASTVMSDGAIAIPEKRSRVPIVLAALVGLAGLGVAAFFALRPSDDDTKAAATSADAGPVVASAPDAAAAVTPPMLDAAVAVAADAAVAVDAAVAAKSNPGGRDRVTPPPSEGDPSINENLRNAERALAAKNYDLAEHLSDGVLMSPGSSGGQKARASSVRGALMCAKYNKDDKARDIARSLSGALRQRVVQACRAANLPIE